MAQSQDVASVISSATDEGTIMVSMHFADRVTPAQFWQRVADQENAVRASFTAFPVYGLGSWHGTILLAEWDGDTLCLQYGVQPTSWLRVHSTRTPPADVVLRLRLTEDGLADLDTPPTSTMLVPVDGTPTDFAVWSNRYAAATTGIALEWQNLDPSALALTRVTTIEPYLEGRRALLRHHRGEPDPA